MIFCSKFMSNLPAGKYRGEVVYISDDRIDFVIYNLGFGDTVSSTVSFHHDKLRSMISAVTLLPEFAVAWMKDEDLVKICKRYYGIALELEFYVHDKGTQVDLQRFDNVK